MVNRDINGFPFWIDLEGRINHQVIIEWKGMNSTYSYENILKNYEKEDGWGSFNIKCFNDLGAHNLSYSYISLNGLMRFPAFTSLLQEYHPHLLL